MNNLLFTDKELSNLKIAYLQYYKPYSASLPVTDFRAEIEKILRFRLKKVKELEKILPADVFSYLVKYVIYEHAMRYHNTLLSYYRRDIPQEIEKEMSYYNSKMDHVIATKLQYDKTTFLYFQGRISDENKRLNEGKKDWQAYDYLIIDSLNLTLYDKDYLKFTRLEFREPRKIVSGEEIQKLHFSSNEIEAQIISAFKEFGGLVEGMELNWQELLPNDSALLGIDKNAKVVLNFWSTSCMPCLNKFARMKKDNWTIEGKNYILINVCVDTERDKFIDASKIYSIPGISLFLDSVESKKIKHLTSSLPKTILLNSEGKIEKMNFIL